MWTSFFSSCACAGAATTSAAARARAIFFMSSSSKGTVLDSAPVEQRARNRSDIHVLELAAQRDAPGDAAHLDIARAQHLSNVVRRSLAFIGEIRGEDHFP